MTSVTIVIPAYNAEATLPACLDGISSLTYPVEEVILFSDGATDSTEEIAEKYGATIIRNRGRPLGPANGRNEAVKVARTEFILFVDADVIVSPTCLELLIADLEANGAAAAFGSYDDSPSSQRVTSLYANLRHHYVHQHSLRDATTFWSGLGLIRRDIFLACGGFDAEKFVYPSVEDIELGVRIINAGHRIRLVPEALAKHYKDWSLWRVWHTDVARRALPWARIIVSEKTTCSNLNVSLTERVRAGIAVLLIIQLLISLFQPLFAIPTIALTTLYLVLNSGFFGLLVRRISFGRAIGAIAMHLCYHVYSCSTFVLVLAFDKLELFRRPTRA
ncbi:glycosyltransferase [Altererythrobacter salegens]|uniref:Glycosyltransferase n=1 Tax=Croceibacterium salegens TaxID=1737568 RepID=A0A6I4SZA9_9SPHN|nr:glycosyltransferase [Croceibacterium salegens]MXO60729.1 glycosyltransferase [Croceibacterium salegens]